MVAGTILLAALMLLITQLMIQGASGEWPRITLASEFGWPADQIYASQVLLDTSLRFLANEVPLWLVLVLCAAVIYWLVDLADELLARLFGRRRPTRPAQPALSPEAPGLVDGA